MGAMSFEIHCRLLTLLRATYFDAIDLAAVNAANKEPRHSVAAVHVTSTGFMCLVRARERRLCGSNEMTIAGVTGTAPVVACSGQPARDDGAGARPQNPPKDRQGVEWRRAQEGEGAGADATATRGGSLQTTQTTSSTLPALSIAIVAFP
jgi:hypothetical protein